MQQLRSKVQSTRKPKTTPKALQCTTNQFSCDRWQKKKAIKEENNVDDVGEEELQLDQIKVRFKRRCRNVEDKIHKQRP